MNQPLTDFQISLKKIQFLSPKVNQGLKFIFVIDGELMVEIDSRYYVLKEQDLLVINRNQLFQVKGNEANRVLVLDISDSFMDRYYPEYRNSRFEVFSQEIEMGREIMLDKMRKLLVELMITYSRKDESYQIEMQGYICDILLILIRRFKQRGTAIEKIDANDIRLTKMVDYLEKNYHQVITLEDMAQKFYLSTGYLSRYFKQKIGMGFNRFLMEIRLKHSVKDLVYTDDTISQIAMKNGFANTKSFSKLFKEKHEVTPHIYREIHSEAQIDSFQSLSIEDTDTLVNTPEILAKLGSVLTKHDQSYTNTETRFEELQLDVTDTINQNLSLPDHVLIVRELKELQKEDVRSQILMAKDDMRLNYIGISHLLSGETITAEVETDEEIATSSPYFKSDVALNFMKKNGLSLFVRIEYQEITKNEEFYFQKLYGFMKHCLQVYGASYLKTWHFLFYESYFTGAEALELKRVYLKMYDLLKELVPDIHVGVFLPFSFKEEKTKEPHKWILTEGNHIDFIAYHSNQNDMIDFKELSDNRFNLTKDYVKENTAKIKSYLKKHHLEKPMHLISWNTLSGNTRFTNGTFFRAALVLKSVLDIANDVESIGFWINTALHEGSDNGQRIRIEGLEFFHYFSGKRPAFFAMMFANKLDGTIIARGSDYLMTKTDRGYQLVLMNCKTINPYYSIEEAFLQKLNKEIQVKIAGLEAGEYQIRKYIFDKDHGALYTKWWNLNSRHGIDLEIIDYINRTSHPDIELYDETITGEWSFYSYLTVNAIHFFEIRKAM
ncbi:MULTISPECIES: helix-turn-helix domain-containing protein [unclassified Mesobacillus]|uniref:helix-turn-helix domain-containing protein n=1 Tax=unclassified Mesobacillus TaxID=2675270 RepID=UPI00203E78AE|nr:MULTISPECIES: helix-turn-helix domain-containing protein [unclassified Mesobacillus]MCM3124992.1 helix-turn-helix domain-containing protein [Mesobacillus sp. MER 33]MCM3235248.1 helix-turn-helix domain-containing protein [Mesobacillus sp. MER 48]